MTSKSASSFDPKDVLGREPTAQEVWPLDAHVGFQRSIQSAGTVAAPLLAGFSLTLLVLLLPTLPHASKAGTPASAQATVPFSAFPEIAATLFLLAGLLLIASVQATISMRKFAHTPSELEAWYPEYFRVTTNREPEVTHVADWTTDRWPAIAVEGKWYGGWVRFYLFSQLLIANRWATAARNLYHLGILASLAGLAVAVFPPASAHSAERWVLSAIALAGLVGEIIWILLVGALERLRSKA